MFTDSSNNHESEIQATRCFPTNREQIGPSYGVLKHLGVRGDKLRDLYYKGYKTSQQLTPGFLDLGPSVQGAGPQMGEGTHCAVALR